MGQNYMNTKKVNPLTIQSKQWLLDALLQLMKEKTYNEITIKELTARANLDRKTFYRHFKTKDDILELPSKEIFDKYVEKLESLPQLTSHEVLKTYFHLCLQHIDFFKLLQTHNLQMVILIKLSEYLPMLNDMFLDKQIYSKKSIWELTYEAGGLWNITILWIRNGAKETPDEMARIVNSISSPI